MKSMSRSFWIKCCLVTVAIGMMLSATRSFADTGTIRESRSRSLTSFALALESARRCLKTGDYDSAIQDYRRAIEISERSFPAPDFTLGIACNELARTLELHGKAGEALRANQKAIDTWSGVARSLTRAYRQGQKPPTACEEQLNRAGGLDRLSLNVASGLAMCSVFCRRNEPDMDIGPFLDLAYRTIELNKHDEPAEEKCLTLNMLSLLFFPDDLARSRLLASRALAIAPRAGAKTLTPRILRRLACVCAVQSDFLPSVKYASAALAIDREIEGAHGLHEQEDLLQLARSFVGLGNNHEAGRYFDELIQSMQQVPPENQLLLDVLLEIGSFRLETGSYAQAYEILLTAKELSAGLYGGDSLDYAQCRQVLAFAAFRLGKIDECLAELERVREIKINHGASLYDLNLMTARVNIACGKVDLAQDHCLAAAYSFRKQIQEALPGLVTAQQIAMLDDSSRPLISQLLTICQITGDPSAAYPHLLNLKGLLLDMLRAHSYLNRKSCADEDLRLLRRKIEKNRSALLLERQSLSTDSSVRRDSLMEEREALQRQWLVKAREISDVSSSDATSSFRSVSLDQLRASLGEHDCLIDFYKYKSVEDGHDSYLAFLVRRDKSIVPVRIQGANELEASLARWLASIRRGRQQLQQSISFDASGDKRLSLERDVFTVGSSGPIGVLDETEERSRFANLMKPLTDAVTQADRRIVISCDGELFRAPLQLLFDTGDSSSRLVSQIDSPRDLTLASKVSSFGKQNILLVGGVDYSPTGYPLLSASGQEVARVAEIARTRQLTPRVLSGLDATRDAVMRLSGGFDFLHLATHGLFLTSNDDSCGVQSDSLHLDYVFSRRSPLLNSALLFTIKPSKKGKEVSFADTELSAEDVLAMNVRKGSHVALSACETGLGQALRGQGIMGLRAAFMASGCRTVLMSLWPVDDTATAELMSEYYSQLWKEGESPARALLMAQRKIREYRSSPYFWAGWTITGHAW